MPVVRPLVAFAISALLLGHPASAAACLCSERFTPVETHERSLAWTADGWPPPEELADADGPLLLTVEHAEDVGGLELWVNGQTRSYSAREVDDDTLCPRHLVALVPDEPWREGDRIRIENAVLRERLGAGSINEPRYAFERTVGVGRPQRAVELTARVEWVPEWPHLVEGSCIGDQVVGLETQGTANVTVETADAQVDYVVRVTVELPDGSAFRAVTTSIVAAELVDGEPVVTAASGSRARLWLPLTRSRVGPECVRVEVFDERLLPVLDEEFCPVEADLGRPTVAHTFAASVRELPSPPVQPDGRAALACAVRPTGRPKPVAFGWCALAALAWLGARRQRTAPRTL